MGKVLLCGMKILLVDNYDSFTYIIRNYLLMCDDTEVMVIRNDEDFAEHAQRADALVLSPGPGLPSESGYLMEIIQQFHKTRPMLGVCLGHQAIAEFFGAKLMQLDQVCHGIPDLIEVKCTDVLFKGLPGNLEVARYHSWMVDHRALPESLVVTSQDKQGRIMSLRHSTLPLFGVQFHPESIMTISGMQIVRNWVRHAAQH
jgi:anthranilate synthase component 2